MSALTLDPALADADNGISRYQESDSKASKNFSDILNGALVNVSAAIGYLLKKTWAPTLTNLAQGNGTLTAYSLRVGDLVLFKFNLTFGTTTTVTGAPVVTLPDTLGTAGTYAMLFSGHALDASTGVQSPLNALRNGNTSLALRYSTVTGSAVVSTALSASAPVTTSWATGDQIVFMGAFIR